jgi:hypothetical protein
MVVRHATVWVVMQLRALVVQRGSNDLDSCFLHVQDQVRITANNTGCLLEHERLWLVGK